MTEVGIRQNIHFNIILWGVTVQIREIVSVSLILKENSSIFGCSKVRVLRT